MRIIVKDCTNCPFKNANVDIIVSLDTTQRDNIRLNCRLQPDKIKSVDASNWAEMFDGCPLKRESAMVSLSE